MTRFAVAFRPGHRNPSWQRRGGRRNPTSGVHRVQSPAHRPRPESGRPHADRPGQEVPAGPARTGAMVACASHLVVRPERHATRKGRSSRFIPEATKTTRSPACSPAVSPVRPNLIALSLCKIISVKENAVEVEKIDAFDGTPVLDLKPYAPGQDSAEEVKVPKWAGPK